MEEYEVEQQADPESVAPFNGRRSQYAAQSESQVHPPHPPEAQYGGGGFGKEASAGGSAVGRMDFDAITPSTLKTMTAQRTWHTCVVIVTLVLMLMLAIFSIATGGVDLYSESVPPFEGRVGFTEATFTYAPANMSVRIGLNSWNEYPQLAPFQSAFRLGLAAHLVGFLLVLGLAVVQCCRLRRNAVRPSRMWNVLVAAILLVFTVLGFANFVHMEVTIAQNLPQLTTFLQQATGLAVIKASPSNATATTGIVEWLLVLLMIGYGIRGCVGPRCQRRCVCCGCAFSPDIL